MAATVDERMAQACVELADTLVAGYDLMEFLQTLTDRCVDLLEVDAAGLLLADSRDALRLVATSTVLLRRFARDYNHPLTELSGEVIHGTARITVDG